MEEYMEGPEFSIDALVYDGTMTITGFADRHIFFPPYFIEMGHTMPTRISKDKYNEYSFNLAKTPKEVYELYNLTYILFPTKFFF